MTYNNVLELIGNTPIVEIKCFDTGSSRLFLKLENQNPGGSWLVEGIGEDFILCNVI